MFGLCQQDRGRIKPIYVHTKLVVADDETLLTGSANMDDMSFFFSSELALLVHDAALARDTRMRLASEHLGAPCPDDWDAMLEAFRAQGLANLDALTQSQPLVGRPVFMAPKERLDVLLSRVYYPNKLAKALYKLGLDTEDLWLKLRARL